VDADVLGEELSAALIGSAAICFSETVMSCLRGVITSATFLDL